MSGRVAVVEEMGELDLHRDRADYLAEARHLQILYVPDFEHQGAEFFADETHPALAQIHGVEVAVRQVFRMGSSGAEK